MVETRKKMETKDQQLTEKDKEIELLKKELKNMKKLYEENK